MPVTAVKLNCFFKNVCKDIWQHWSKNSRSTNLQPKKRKKVSTCQSPGMQNQSIPSKCAAMAVHRVMMKNTFELISY